MATVVTLKRRRRKVAVLYGAVAADAAPDEQDVLVEVATASRMLTGLGYAPVAVPVTLDLEAARARLLDLKPAFVFNLVESLDGQGRLIHLALALLDSLGLPHTGAGHDAMFLTSKKTQAKRMLAAAGLPTAPWWEPPADLSAPVAQDGPGFAGPYIVKSVWEHASIGIGDDSITADPKRLAAICKRRQKRFGGEWFVEKFIDGREFNIAVLTGASDGPRGPEVLPLAEMTFVDFPAGKPRIVDYEAKWDEASFGYNNTVRRFDFGPEDAGLLASLREISLACWKLFDLAGHVRVDFRVDAAGNPYVLEVNTNPCLSPDAGFAAAAARAGLTPEQVMARILGDLRSVPATRRVGVPATAQPGTAVTGGAQ
jgi:D-alanine-D-alanine ligase